MSRIAVRPLLFRTIALLVVVNATAGIAVIVAGSGQIGSTEAHVLETTGLLSLAALLLLPCVLAYDAGRPKAFPQLPTITAASLTIGFGLAVYLVWEDPVGDTLAKIAATFGVAGGGLAHVCLLSLLRLRREYIWLQLAAMLLTMALAAMIIAAVWTVPVEGGFDDWKIRLFAVVAILAAATSLLAALIDRLAPSRPGRSVPVHPSFCPNCGAALAGRQSACAVCGARFRVEFQEAEEDARRAVQSDLAPP